MSIYSQQESLTKKVDLEDSWVAILEVIHDIIAKNEELIILGDMNRKIGNDKYGVPGNHPQISVGGQLIRDMLSAGTMVLVNRLDVTKGGPWTRFDPSDPENDDKKCIEC